MYGELDVLYLTDEYDTVLAYENKGKVDQAADRRDPLMDTLNSMDRVQQVELICGNAVSTKIHEVHKVSFALKICIEGTTKTCCFHLIQTEFKIGMTK